MGSHVTEYWVRSQDPGGVIRLIIFKVSLNRVQPFPFLLSQESCQ